jgi:hypothetical protein
VLSHLGSLILPNQGPQNRMLLAIELTYSELRSQVDLLMLMAAVCRAFNDWN